MCTCYVPSQRVCRNRSGDHYRDFAWQQRANESCKRRQQGTTEHRPADIGSAGLTSLEKVTPPRRHKAGVGASAGATVEQPGAQTGEEAGHADEGHLTERSLGLSQRYRVSCGWMPQEFAGSSIVTPTTVPGRRPGIAQAGQPEI